MKIYRFRPDMVYDCEVEVPDGTKSIPQFHTFQAPPIKDNHYAIMMGGWKLVEGEKPIYPPVPSVPEVKHNLYRELATRRWVAEDAGTTVMGIKVPTDRQTQSKLTAAYIKASANSSYVIPSWKFAEGIFKPLDAQTIIMIADAVESHVQLCFQNESNLSQKISSCTSIDELNTIDLNFGWPE